MPELPDVEIFRQYMNATSLHQTIETVDINAGDMLKGISETKLKQHLRKNQFISGHRHGKYLYIISHRKKGDTCPNCGNGLQQIKVSGRTTCLCPNCQQKTG